MVRGGGGGGYTPSGAPDPFIRIGGSGTWADPYRGIYAALATDVTTPSNIEYVPQLPRGERVFVWIKRITVGFNTLTSGLTGAVLYPFINTYTHNTSGVGDMTITAFAGKKVVNQTPYDVLEWEWNGRGHMLWLPSQTNSNGAWAGNICMSCIGCAATDDYVITSEIEWVEL